MSDRRRIVVPIAILSAGFAAFGLLMSTRSGVETGSPESVAPLVRVLTVEPRTVRLRVEAYGTVEPRIETELVPQVSGEVVWVSPALARGGYFESDEVLVRIDPTEYEAEVESARASLDRAESELARARRENERLERLASNAAVSEARADDAANTYRAADATLREARLRLARAQRDRVRTELRSAYVGRVRDKSVDIGQFVARGESLAQLYAIEYAEVPLPVPDRELAYLDLQHPYRSLSQTAAVPGPNVVLRANFAGADQTWRGQIVRTEAEIDVLSRTVTVVARIEDPYGRTREGPAVPLPVGLFVAAEIEGRSVEGAVVLPGTALREGNRVYVVDRDGRLHFRAVEVVRTRRDEVVIGGGLAAGERVCVSPLRGAVDGMAVRVASDGTAVAGSTP